MLNLRNTDSTFAVPAEVGSRYAPAGLAIMCEAPGAQEAATSRPLVGPAGGIFEGLLAEAGLERDELLLMNRVRCRPPGNRLGDAPGSVEACDEWTQKELATYQPSVVLLMGGTAIAAVFGSTAKVSSIRGTARCTGEEHPWGKRVFLATYHPASLLPYRGPANRPLVLQDLVLAKEYARAIAEVN